MPAPLIITRPESNEYPEWAADEIAATPYNDLISGLQASYEASLRASCDIPENTLLYRYAPSKRKVMHICCRVPPDIYK